MVTIIVIILAAGVIFGVIALLGSGKSDPKDRATEAAAAAAGGAMMAGGCILQLIVVGLMALVGIFLLSLIFGR